MELRYITCSDPRNYNTFTELEDLWYIDNRVELAVQMHPGKVSPDTERYNWVRQLVDCLYGKHREYKFAIHVNCDWCDDICNGNIPVALKPLFDVANYYTGKPVVGRIQLNMPEKTAENFNAQKLKPVIESYGDKEFILQYNTRTANSVEQLHKTGAKFSLLFDASGGRGIDAENWRAPIYPEEHPMGYSGGLSPENVTDNLDKIKTVAGDNKIWIDAEGKLKQDDKFDFNRAAKYICNTLKWEAKQR